MAIVLALGHDVEERTKRNRIFEIDSLLEKYSDESVFKYFSKKLKTLKKESNTEYVLEEIFSVLDNIEVLKESWPSYIKVVEDTLFKHMDNADNRTLTKWNESMEIPMEQLMVYYIYKYFCPAVYDGQVYARTKFSVISSIIIREITKAMLVKQKILISRSNLEKFKDCCFVVLSDAARRFSKEVEHSDENLELMRDAFTDEERFGIDDILTIL